MRVHFFFLFVCTKRTLLPPCTILMKSGSTMPKGGTKPKAMVSFLWAHCLVRADLRNSALPLVVPKVLSKPPVFRSGCIAYWSRWACNICFTLQHMSIVGRNATLLITCDMFCLTIIISSRSIDEKTHALGDLEYKDIDAIRIHRDCYRWQRQPTMCDEDSEIAFFGIAWIKGQLYNFIGLLPRCGYKFMSSDLTWFEWCKAVFVCYNGFAKFAQIHQRTFYNT